MSARNRELLTLLLAGLVASTAFASAWIADAAQLDQGWLPYAALLGGVFLAGHLVARVIVPDADPTLLPLAALLCAIGLTFVYRIAPEDGRRQLGWVAIGVLAFALVLVWLRYDYRVLERYKYVFGVSAIVLLMLPSVPGLGRADQRGQALGERRAAPVPARRDREDLPRHLPRRVPPRQARGARPGPAEGLRAAAC